MDNPITRRDALVLAGATIALPMIGCRAAGLPQQDSPEPDATIGLFVDAARVAIPNDAKLVRSTGWSRAGVGVALYREEPSVEGAGMDRASFLTADGRSFRLADDQALYVDMFGAMGDLQLGADGNVSGGTNDTAAFTAASAWIERAGGGTLHCRPDARYLVGEQRFRGTYANPDGKVADSFAWAGQPILRVWGARGHVTIEGNGATLKAAPGYRYGVFDARSGQPKRTTAPHLAPAAELGFPYIGMIDLRDCQAGFTIRDLTLDGSVAKAIIGGEHGDLGRQINGCGLYTLDNRGPVIVENVESHHHPWDGWLLRHVGSVRNRAGKPTVSRFNGHHNGRQALSLTGGEGGTVVDSRFTHSGRDIGLASAPAAGLDIEPEGPMVRDWSFARCLFGGSAGVALLASVNDAANLRFRDCQIHGAYEIALWPGKPGMLFEDCVITGMTTAVHPGTVFRRCRFSDDVRLSPFGRIHLGGQILLNLSNAAKARIDRCTIERRSDGIALYCDQQDAVFDTCTIRASQVGTNVVWGQWIGRSVLTIPAAARTGGINGYFTHVAKGASLLVNGTPL